MATPKNPFAFPSPVSLQRGMTLRDYFAAAALQGRLAVTLRHDGDEVADAAESLACLCYLLADAMLAEREKEAK